MHDRSIGLPGKCFTSAADRKDNGVQGEKIDVSSE